MGRGRFSLRPVICWAGAPGSCPAPLRTIWHLAIGSGTARGAGLFVCSFSYWSVVSFLSASCQLYLAVSSKFVASSKRFSSAKRVFPSLGVTNQLTAQVTSNQAEHHDYPAAR